MAVHNFMDWAPKLLLFKLFEAPVFSSEKEIKGFFLCFQAEFVNYVLCGFCMREVGVCHLSASPEHCFSLEQSLCLGMCEKTPNSFLRCTREASLKIPVLSCIQKLGL